jgi:hypothetical protein
MSERGERTNDGARFDTPEGSEHAARTARRRGSHMRPPPASPTGLGRAGRVLSPPLAADRGRTLRRRSPATTADRSEWTSRRRTHGVHDLGPD